MPMTLFTHGSPYVHLPMCLQTGRDTFLEPCSHNDQPLTPAPLHQVFAMGFVSVFEQIMESVPSAERAKVFDAYIMALGGSA